MNPSTAVLTFDEAIEESGDLPRSILLGNGFSIAQAGSQFSYGNLLQRSGLQESSPILKVFQAINTVDFEEVMFALEHAALIEKAYGDADRSEEFQRDAGTVRESLINAIRAVHPGAQFEIPERQLNSCADFLRIFRIVFTLNYDLLLYWVVLKTKMHTDGFGLGKIINGFKTFQVGALCSTYYLHGALHLFLSQTGETRKRILENSTLVGDIAETIRREKQLPIFVAEGTMTQKLKRINSIPYLRHCHDELRRQSGSFFVFGHSVADNDIHIYDAIFGSQIEKFFFFIRDPSRDWSKTREKLARFAERRRDISIQYVDAASARVWG
jgi:hypothetical protein